jgi:hypothetical protein
MERKFSYLASAPKMIISCVSVKLAGQGKVFVEREPPSAA